MLRAFTLRSDAPSFGDAMTRRARSTLVVLGALLLGGTAAPAGAQAPPPSLLLTDARLGQVDETGFASGVARPLRGAKIVLRGASMTLRGRRAAREARRHRRMAGGRAVAERLGCAVVPGPAACAQVLPANGALMLKTAAARRPPFTRLHRLRLLTTGDSMIQIIDNHLKQRLDRRRGANVRSDAHIGSGISRAGPLNWVRTARGQSSGFKPDVTVVFLGANDGLPIAGAPCCDAAGSGRTRSASRR